MRDERILLHSCRSSVTRNDLDDESELQSLTKAGTMIAWDENEIEGCLNTELDSTRHETFVVEPVKEVTNLIL